LRGILDFRAFCGVSEGVALEENILRGGGIGLADWKWGSWHEAIANCIRRFAAKCSRGHRMRAMAESDILGEFPA